MARLENPQRFPSVLDIRKTLDREGPDGVTTLNEKYGRALRKPLQSYIRSMPEGPARMAFEALATELWPVSNKAGMPPTGVACIGRNSRVSIKVDPALEALPGSRMRWKVVDVDGVIGMFLWVSHHATPTESVDVTKAARHLKNREVK